MFVRFSSIGGLPRRLPWWQTGLLALLALPFLLLLLPIALFGLYRMRKQMKKVESQFKAFEQAARERQTRGPKAVQVEMLEDHPVIELSREDFRSRVRSTDSDPNPPS